MQNILFSIWFFLPAGIANIIPVFASKLPILRGYCYPLDFNKTFKNKRILGNNKTIRGVVVGVLIGIIICILQYNFYQSSLFLQGNLSFDYSKINPVELGFLLSFGALTGDSIKSFFKRQMGVFSGKSWFPFDQVDYILGGIFFSLLVIKLTLLNYVTIFIIYFLLHIVISYIGFLLHLKESAI